MFHVAESSQGQHSYMCKELFTCQILPVQIHTSHPQTTNVLCTFSTQKKHLSSQNIKNFFPMMLATVLLLAIVVVRVLYACVTLQTFALVIWTAIA
jgi:hypothetical protein